MLEELTPAQLVEWRAARALVPLEDGWLQAGVIAAADHNQMERLMAMKAGRARVARDRLLRPEDFIPRARCRVAGDESIAAHHAAVAARYGATL